ncbi:P pilus assembly protein, chaperone PapD [Herbaspirillum sp. CF444]|uniref:fimbrial biogenesis chaperone n=1 Tax=Herbaspirillum sp. CF444 TaxID=1144319 RepID=UPI00027233B8|nr:molecular chaperone [Herbaspirillum sp. CF444]EJL88737.1 P pilus assembly protein, chaperone PapD [Herbaspirillum sp. CF444]
MALRHFLVGTGAVLALCSATGMVQAEVVLQTTRVIVPAGLAEATLRMKNEGEQASLVQAWVDAGEGSQQDVPFVLTPTLFRLGPGSSQSVRIVYTGEPLPTGKETLFWLNVLDVPPKSTLPGDRLQVAVRSRIKLLFRPEGLPARGDALTWVVAAGKSGRSVLRVLNTSPYVHNFGSITYRAGGREFDAGMGYVLPDEDAVFPLPPEASSFHSGDVTYVEIDDYGGTKAKDAVARSQ